MKNTKGQGALEYLIIIAAVLAIAAIVVLFITNAFQSTNTSLSECKTAAAKCATELATSEGASCPYCATDCADSATWIAACESGLAEQIFEE